MRSEAGNASVHGVRLAGLFAAIVLSVAVLAGAGCGKRAGAGADSEAFKAAIGAYLQQKSMGMKVAELKSLKTSGDTATGVASMQDAEGLYSVKVTWEFSFRRDQNGWTVVSHKTLN